MGQATKTMPKMRRSNAGAKATIKATKTAKHTNTG
jgi:hypothetical protein